MNDINNEEANLCDDTQENIENTTNETVIKSPKIKIRHGLVEFILAASLFAISANPSLTSQYIYDNLSEKYNFVHNSNSLNSSSGLCFKSNNSIQVLVQKETSKYMIYFNIAANAPSIIMTMFLGTVSDMYGRKICIIIPITAYAFTNFINVIAVYYKFPPLMLIVSSLITGFGGSWTVLFMSCYAYLSDITSVTARSLRCVVMEAGVKLAAILSQLFIGQSIKQFGYLYSYLIVLAILTIIILVTIFLFHDIDISINRKENTITEISLIKKTLLIFKKTFLTYSLKVNNRRWKLITMLIVLFFLCSATFGKVDIILLSLKDDPFCWSSDKVGYVNAGYSTFYLIGAIVVTKFLEKYIGDIGLVLIANVSAILTLVVFAFANNLILVVISIILGLCSANGISIIRSIMSKLVFADEQGAMFSGIASIETISSLLALVSMDALYMDTVELYKPTAFLVCAGFSIISLLITIIYMIKVKQELKLSNLYVQSQ